MKLIEYADTEMMMMSLSDKLASDLNAALMTHDTASFAVPGGSTPAALFDTLSAVRLPWDRVTVLLGDERWVPESSERSNARLVRERLLTDNAAAAGFFGYYREGEDPDAALPELGQALRAHLPLSVLLLGMGADMHTASLFPGADGLQAALSDSEPPLLAIKGDALSEPRVTLTAPVLKGAMATHILITGAEKRRVIEEAERIGDPVRAPVSLVLGQATVHWAE